MVSLNWVGLSAVQTLRRHTGLAIHGHRNGFGGMGRHPLLGMGVRAYQVLYRLAGIDHMHVHGMGGKFSDLDEDVTEAALHCLEPMGEGDDRVMPIFSSGQCAGTLPHTLVQVGSDDLMFLSGGGIMAHPGGPAAGLVSLRQAHEAVGTGASLADQARARPELAQALATFGPQGSGMGYVFVADGFTGASDTLATLARGGLRVRLFRDLPGAEALAGIEAWGIATLARSLGREDMAALAGRIGAGLAALAPDFVHVKICSTFDSSASTGNVALLAQGLAGALGIADIAVLAGQPSLGRYAVFGTLFARGATGGPTASTGIR